MSNYYTKQIDKAMQSHESKYDLNLRIIGSKNSSNNIVLPTELLHIIKDWYNDNVCEFFKNKK